MRTGAFHLDTDHTTRAWLATACFMLAMIVAITPAYFLDGRTLWDVSVWNKPLKFCIALMIHFATLAVLAQQLAPRRRAGPVLSVFVWLSVAAALFEIIYIAIQAARGRHSHFNFETSFEATMYTAMGAGALLLILAPFVLGVLLAFQRDGDKSGLRLGAVIGLLLAPILTLVVAGYMSSANYSHWVGDAVSDAGGVPLFGWSRDVGDLRPAHFLATHAMQILPVVGLVADRFVGKFARGVIALAAVALVAGATLLFIQALAGEPVWPRG
ncbi:MAG: hypothetical protein WD076_10340 [Parvularculaceae bacterium]